MNYELFVSWRYLRSKRKEVFISLVSVISVSGVAVGVMALIIVLAVMTGLNGELRDKILGTNAHIIVFKRGGWINDYAELRTQIAQTPQVVGVSPFIFRQVMIQSNTGSSESTVKGVDVQAEQTTSALAEHIVRGQLDFLDQLGPDEDSGGHGILLGSQLAQKLQVTVGDTVTVISPMKDATSSWPIPKRQIFQVSGVFEYGMYEYDLNLVYISLAAAQTFFETNGLVTGVSVKVENLFRSNTVAQKLQDMLGVAYSVRDWTEMNKNLFAIFRLYKKALFLMLALIVIVACLNIASTLIMMVMEKNKDIAILKSMGASARSIQKVFVLQGVGIGLVGTGLGSILGMVVCWVADTYQLIKLEGGVYYLNYLPFRMVPFDILLVAICSLLICFGATVYPAKQAARLDPAEALRCE
jgi:lipoprotein-releasing system permease protein